jgi:carboxyl-terminal processing protease
MTETNQVPLTTPEKKEQGHRLFKKAFLAFFILLLFGVTYYTGYENGREMGDVTASEVLSPEDAIIVNKKGADTTIDFSLFWKVWELLKDKYVDRTGLDARELFYGAIDGMLAATGDPYTTFFSPEENREFNEDISGVFEGIGAEMGMKDNIITIIAPLEGMPAEKAGLLPGDKIVKIDDVASSGYSLDEAVKRIRGAKGTSVKLTIFREGDEETRDITVERGIISVKSVRSETKEGNIAYIRVSRFGEDTDALFTEAVKKAASDQSKGVIIDLRSNPGGFLDTAVEMASFMLPSGQIVVIEEDGAGKRKELKARGGDILSALPTVVLINEGSASASEILAGALRENRDNVTLIGKKSYGKGSVQELIPVGKDTAVKITVARWLTPEGHQINKAGITPDIEVGMTAEDRENKRDPQLDRALEELKK